MRQTHEPEERDLTLGKPIRPEPAKPVEKPFEKGNFHKDGSLIGNTATAAQTIADTLRKKSPKDEASELPKIQWRWTLTEIVPGPDGMGREIYADRWFFEGGNEEGYESEESAEEARAELNPIFAFYIGGIDSELLRDSAALNQWIETELQKLCGIPARDVRLLDGESEA